MYFFSIFNYLATKKKVLVTPDIFTFFQYNFRENIFFGLNIKNLYFFLKKHNFKYLLLLTKSQQYKLIINDKRKFKKKHNVNWSIFFKKNPDLREPRKSQKNQIWTLFEVK